MAFVSEIEAVSGTGIFQRVRAVERDTTAYTADGNLLQELDGSEYADTVAHIQTY